MADVSVAAPPPTEVENEQRASRVARARAAEEQRRDGLRRLAHGWASRAEFIERFVRQERHRDYPVVPEDLVDEATTRVYERPTLDGVLAAEIERAIAKNTTPFAMPGDVIALWLLTSDDEAHHVHVSTLPKEAISVGRLLGHVEALGVRFDPAVAISIARRATIVLLNRDDLARAYGPAEVGLCVGCGTEGPRGETCACGEVVP